MNLASLISLTVKETRAALKSSLVMVMCLALGVMSITAVQTLSTSLKSTLAREGQVILGGDASLTLVGRAASPQELKTIESFGTVSKQITMRSMVRMGDKVALTELKAIDANYPLYGDFTRSNGALIEKALLIKLNAKVGDTLTLGETSVIIAGEIVSEPDKFSSGLGLSPRLIVPLEVLNASKLAESGSLTRHIYKVKTANDLAPLLKTFDKSEFDVRTFQNASPQIENQLNRFTEILTFTGLITLLVGALGISHAVRTRIEKKRKDIATLKALGANARQLFLVFGLQIFALTLLGILIGVAAGSFIPVSLASLQGDLLPVKVVIAPSLRAVLTGIGYGLMVAIIASLMPLDRLRLIPVASIYRDGDVKSKNGLALLLTLMMVFALIGVAYLTSTNKLIVLAFTAALLVVFALIWALIRFIKPDKRPMIFALSLGLSLMTSLLWTEGTLNSQLNAIGARSAPSFFFVDIPQNEVDNFKAMTQGKLTTVPNLRGRIVEINGVKAEEANIAESAKWILTGDRGVTTAATLPEGSKLESGTWWGETADALVSLEDKIARDLNVKIGDTITVSVLGRRVTAKIANLRSVNWQSFGINFFMVFSPATFKGAPHTWLATLHSGETTVEQDYALLDKINRAYPGVTAVRVKESIATINDLSQKIAFAVKALSAITLLSAILVLAGAIGASEALRIKEVTLYKVLGATRAMILLKAARAFAFIGAIAAVFALLAGGIITGAVTYFVLKLPPILDLKAALVMIAFALLCTLILGLSGTLRALSKKPAEVLRAL
jgi:putative ABC transport system permease protein